MESLAMMVAVIMLVCLGLGPLALILSYFQRHVLAALIGLPGFVGGLYWFTILNHDSFKLISLTGLMAAVLGFWAVLRALD